MIYTAEGIPASPELEARVKRIDPGLGLRFVNESWAVTFRWPESDSRWQMVREGKQDPAGAFDVVAWLPKGCSVDEAPAWIERSFIDWAKAGRHDIARLLDRLHAHNDAQTERNVAETMDYATELLETNAPTLLAEQGKTTVRHYVTDPGTKKPGRRTKVDPPKET